MSQPSEPDGARPSPLTVEGIAAKRPPRRLSPNLLAAKAHQVAATAEPVEIKKGTLIGDYSVLRRLDEGGMGTVYSAVHPVIGKQVAIKVLHPHVAKQEEAVARFIQEARAVNAIGHPGIVDIFGFGRFVDGRHYITMEYLEGQQLLAYLNQHGPIAPLDMLPLARQLSESLAAAHDKGVVHRDMKPENVFLGVENAPREEQSWPPATKILDFGLAKLIEAEYAGRKPRTRSGVTVGTPYYMSPEQCRGRAIDRRADVYAVGVMMYEMVTGRVPFYAAESVDVLYMHLTQEPEAPSSHRPVPPEIEALILRCMAKIPADRPQSMHALIAELDEVMELLMPADSMERPEHELVEEAEAFFGESGKHQLLREGAMEAVERHRQRAGEPSSPAEPLPTSEEEPGGTRTPTLTAAEPAVERMESLQSAPEPKVATEAPDRAQETEEIEAPAPKPTQASPAASPARTTPRPRRARGAADQRKGNLNPSVAPDGGKTAITAVPRRAPRQRLLWVAVTVLAVAALVLGGLLLIGTPESSKRAPKAASTDLDLGTVELVSDAPVDVLMGGQVVARKVRRLVVARLPAGSTQQLVIRRADGSKHVVKVRVAAGRTVSVAIPAR